MKGNSLFKVGMMCIALMSSVVVQSNLSAMKDEQFIDVSSVVKSTDIYPFVQDRYNAICKHKDRSLEKELLLLENAFEALKKVCIDKKIFPSEKDAKEINTRIMWNIPWGLSKSTVAFKFQSCIKNLTGGNEKIDIMKNEYCLSWGIAWAGEFETFFKKIEDTVQKIKYEDSFWVTKKAKSFGSGLVSFLGGVKVLPGTIWSHLPSIFSKVPKGLGQELVAYNTNNTIENLANVWIAAQRELAMFVTGERYYYAKFANKKFNLFTAKKIIVEAFGTFVKNLIEAKKAFNKFKGDKDAVWEIQVQFRKNLRIAIETWWKDANKNNVKSSKEQIASVAPILEQLIVNDPNDTPETNGSLELCYSYSKGSDYMKHPVKVFVGTLVEINKAYDTNKEIIAIPAEARVEVVKTGEKKVEKPVVPVVPNVVNQLLNLDATLANELLVFKQNNDPKNEGAALIKVWEAAEKELNKFAKNEKFGKVEFTGKKFNMFTEVQDFHMNAFKAFLTDLVEAKKALNTLDGKIEKKENDIATIVKIQNNVRKTLRIAVEAWWDLATENDAKPAKEKIVAVASFLNKLIDIDEKGDKGSLELCYSYSHDDYLKYPVKPFVKTLDAINNAYTTEPELIKIPKEALLVLQPGIFEKFTNYVTEFNEETETPLV